LHTIALNFGNFEDVAFLASTPQVSFIYVIQTTFQDFDIFYYIIFIKKLVYIDLIGVVEPCRACTGLKELIQIFRTVREHLSC
jgi:hypothetical protein